MGILKPFLILAIFFLKQPQNSPIFKREKQILSSPSVSVLHQAPKFLLCTHATAHSAVNTLPPPTRGHALSQATSRTMSPETLSSSYLLGSIWLYQSSPLSGFFFLGFQDTGQLFIHFSSVAQSCPTLCDSMNHSTPGLPVHHQLLESTQTHVH